jgi:hypothetical protein
MNRQNVQKRLLEATSSYGKIWQHIRGDFNNVNIRNEQERTVLFTIDYQDPEKDDDLKVSGTVRCDGANRSLVSEVRNILEDGEAGQVV